MKLSLMQQNYMFGQQDILMKRNRSFSVECTSDEGILIEYDQNLIEETLLMDPILIKVIQLNLENQREHFLGNIDQIKNCFSNYKNYCFAQKQIENVHAHEKRGGLQEYLNTLRPISPLNSQEKKEFLTMDTRYENRKNHQFNVNSPLFSISTQALSSRPQIHKQQYKVTRRIEINQTPLKQSQNNLIMKEIKPLDDVAEPEVQKASVKETFNANNSLTNIAQLRKIDFVSSQNFYSFIDSKQIKSYSNDSTLFQKFVQTNVKTQEMNQIKSLALTQRQITETSSPIRKKNNIVKALFEVKKNKLLRMRRSLEDITVQNPEDHKQKFFNFTRYRETDNSPSKKLNLVVEKYLVKEGKSVSLSLKDSMITTDASPSSQNGNRRQHSQINPFNESIQDNKTSTNFMNTFNTTSYKKSSSLTSIQISNLRTSFYSPGENSPQKKEPIQQKKASKTLLNSLGFNNQLSHANQSQLNIEQSQINSSLNRIKGKAINLQSVTSPTLW